MLTEHI